MTKIFNLNEHKEKDNDEYFWKISEEIFNKIENVPEDDYEKILEIYQDALKKYPDSPHLYSIVSLHLQELDRLSEAEDILKESIEKFPDQFLLHFELSVCLSKQDRFDEAVKIMNRFAEKIPEDNAFLKSEYLSGLASLYLSEKKEKEATDLWISAFETNNNNFFPIAFLAVNLDDYNELKSRSTLLNDAFTFIEIQIQKYFEEINDDEFGDIQEREDIIFLIGKVFVGMYEEEKEDLKTMTSEEKRAFFEEIEIDFFDEEYLDDEYFDDDEIDDDFFDDEKEWIDYDDAESEADMTIYDILSEKDNEMIPFVFPLLGFAGIKENRLQKLVSKEVEPTYGEQFLVKWGIKVVRDAILSFFSKKREEKDEHYIYAKQTAMEVLDDEDDADDAVRFLLNIFKELKN